MKVAIIAYYFKPDETIGAVRPENWAAWLSPDHDVTVVTPRSSHSDEASNDYVVVRVNSFSMKIIEVLNSFRKKIRNKYISSFRFRTNTHKIPSYAFLYRMPCLHDLWFISCYVALCRIKPETIIATHSPYINLVAGFIYKIFHPKTLLWVDYRDLWTDNHTSSGLPFIRVFERSLEKSILKHADVVTTVSRHLLDKISKFAGLPCFLIYNCVGSYYTYFTREYVNHSTLRISYVGTVWSQWRDPSKLFSLLRELINNKVIDRKLVSICVASRNPGDFLTISQDFGLRDIVDYQGGVSRDRAVQIQQESDILLLLESDAEEARGVLTGKVFEYLMTDKPILLVGPGPDSELYQLLLKHDRLFTLHDFDRFLRGEIKFLPRGKPVDYSEISREQLFDIMDSLMKKTIVRDVNG